eukprot:TRINITY_DN1154_c0_g1_i1.p1 TRINITY_DN1154_c0_g1~~TRINITY_DN1154_c0_g1_i1.p1  ORF type:complete len:543 (+),score=141.43 TRINITY_DN1154_c0_g1_i1:58-1686(+)
MTSITLKGVTEYEEAGLHATQMLMLGNVNSVLAEAQQRKQDRAPVEICAVIDRSGSMRGEKLKLVIEALEFMIKEMSPCDKFGVVAYDQRVSKVLPMVDMDPSNQKTALHAVSSLRPGGATNLSGGLLSGMQTVCGSEVDIPEYKPAADIQKPNLISGLKNLSQLRSMLQGGGREPPQHRPAFIDPCERVIPVPQRINEPVPAEVPTTAPTASAGEDEVPATAPVLEKKVAFETPKKATGIKTVMLFTDGHANEGIVSTDGIVQQMHRILDIHENCVVYTFGFGQHNETMLSAIAEAGSGLYTYIASPDEIPVAFAECLGGLLTVAASNLKLQVTPSKGVEILKCMSHTSTDKELQKYSLKDIYSEEERDFVFSIQLPAVAEAASKTEVAELTLTYTLPNGEVKEATNKVFIDRVVKDEQQLKEQTPNEDVDIQRNRLMLIESMEEATKLADAGQWSASVNAIADCKKKVMSSVSRKCKKSQLYCEELDTLETACKPSTWSGCGRKKMLTAEMSHKMQRSSDGNMYSTTSQSIFNAKSKAKK